MANNPEEGLGSQRAVMPVMTMMMMIPDKGYRIFTYSLVLDWLWVPLSFLTRVRLSRVELTGA
jgi:hypothetical protein